jgi:hypothetical protein
MKVGFEIGGCADESDLNVRAANLALEGDHRGRPGHAESVR